MKFRYIHTYTPSRVTYCCTVTGRTVTISNEEGVIQGEPLAGWLYDGAMTSRIGPLRTAPAHRINILPSLHDDLVVLGPVGPAFALVDALRPHMAASHQNIENGKCEALSSSEQGVALEVAQHAATRGIPVAPGGFVVGGVPVGTVEFKETHLESKLHETLRLLRLLTDVAGETTFPAGFPVIQSVVRTIRMCIPSRLNYLWRTVAPSITAQFADRLDKRVFEDVIGICGHNSNTLDTDNVPAAHTARLRFFLPAALGGFGFTLSSAIVEAAFIGSWSLTGRLVAHIVGEGQLMEAGVMQRLGLESALGELQQREGPELLESVKAVSYTHLTLPTIYSV